MLRSTEQFLKAKAAHELRKVGKAYFIVNGIGHSRAIWQAEDGTCYILFEGSAYLFFKDFTVEDPAKSLYGYTVGRIEMFSRVLW